jgi:hypothetical protein
MKVNGIQNNCWYTPHEVKGEINEEASMTVPNQSLSVKTILEKHVNGMRVMVGRIPIYEDGDIDQPVLKSLVDITEAEEELEIVQGRIEEVKAKKVAAKKQADEGGGIFSGKSGEEKVEDVSE